MHCPHCGGKVRIAGRLEKDYEKVVEPAYVGPDESLNSRAVRRRDGLDRQLLDLLYYSGFDSLRHVSEATTEAALRRRKGIGDVRIARLKAMLKAAGLELRKDNPIPDVF